MTSLRVALDRIRRPRARPPDRRLEPEAIREDPSDDPDAEAHSTAGPLGSLRSRLAGPRSPSMTYLGVILMALGFGITALTWSKVAGLLAVSLQLPYLASGGLAAIGLVVLGATLISLATSRRDAYRREARLAELSAVLRTISETLGDGNDGDDEIQR